MRVVLVIFGILLLLAGVVFALQGAGILEGSVMSNDPTWIWIGAATALAGLGIAVLGLRSRPKAKKA